jgi:hypothetical protein
MPKRDRWAVARAVLENGFIREFTEALFETHMDERLTRLKARGLSQDKSFGAGSWR